MNINGTLLALQMMNGVKVYKVNYLDRSAAKFYSYKSDLDLVEGDMVVVPVGTEGFGLAEVMGEQEDVDFDASYALKWVIQRLDNIEAIAKSQSDADRKAKAKLVKSKAQTAAKEYLAAAGLDAKDLLGIEDMKGDST